MNPEINFIKFTKHGPKLQALLDAPSARAVLESQAQSGALPVATGSLPGWSAEALCVEWRRKAEQRFTLADAAQKDGDRVQARWLEQIGNAYAACADDLRRLEGLPPSRQPEENTKVTQMTEPHSVSTPQKDNRSSCV